MILVTGATGFIGKHLLSRMSTSGGEAVRALTRHNLAGMAEGGVNFVQGNIADAATLDIFLEAEATLVNLAFSNVPSTHEAVETTKRLVEKCAEKGIKRFIHCSSISVYGRVKGVVNESTSCVPYGAYGLSKLVVEQTLINEVQDQFELIILRPTEVFGEGGYGLRALLDALTFGNPIVNYLRSSMYGARLMHLVPVETVVDAILFFIDNKSKFNKEIFNISADHDPSNTFRAVEKLVFEEMKLKYYPALPVDVPESILKTLLAIAGRSTIDPKVVYSTTKLHGWGFIDQHELKDSIKRYVHSYNLQHAQGSVD